MCHTHFLEMEGSRNTKVSKTRWCYFWASNKAWISQQKLWRGGSICLCLLRSALHGCVVRDWLEHARSCRGCNRRAEGEFCKVVGVYLPPQPLPLFLRKAWAPHYSGRAKERWEADKKGVMFGMTGLRLTLGLNSHLGWFLKIYSLDMFCCICISIFY